MELTPIVYLIVCPLVFLAGFVDSIAGGGGLISLPAYMLSGLPAHYVLGTNKMAMSIGTLTATVKYIRAKQFDAKAGLLAGASSFAGAVAGSRLSLSIPDDILHTVMLIILPCVAVFLVIQRNFGTVPTVIPNGRGLVVRALLIGLFIGCYDGFIGPGTGTFFLLAFTAFLGFDLLKSSGCAKIANLASNVASMLVFGSEGKILFALAIPAALCASAGNYLGAKAAIKGGGKYIRYTVFIVIGLLFIKIAAELMVA